MATPGGNATAADVTSGAAWRQFCDRMAALGDELLGPAYPGSPAERAEGYRHLANQVACWTTYALGSSDAESPLLFRHNDLVYCWGGPNVDQNARRTVISGTHSYRLSGSMGACEEFAVQVKRGEMHTGDAGVDGTLWASELGLGPGDDFAISISPNPAPGHHLQISPSANLLHVRDYYFDWKPAEPATFVLERVDQDGSAPAPLTPERLGQMLEIAATQVESSIRYWRTYQEDLRAVTGPNVFSEPALVPEGVADMFYAHAFIRLEPDEALVVTLRPADAAHWNLQLYSRAWYESLDFANRVTHLNEAMVRSAADGTAEIVISATDPGTPNWMDTEGRTEVMATSRWTRPPQAPAIAAQVMPLSDVPARGSVSPAQRRDTVAARRAHVAWRYHT